MSCKSGTVTDRTSYIWKFSREHGFFKNVISCSGNFSAFSLYNRPSQTSVSFSQILPSQ